MKITALIPAYNPPETLIGLVQSLAATDLAAVIVVNDGSAQEFAFIFDEIEKKCGATILRHAINLGKGAALKTGLNFVFCQFPDHIGVVTLDADGQHLPEDVVNVANELHSAPESLVLGARSFAGDIPWRSQFGNGLTRILFQLLVGKGLSDTQTGLRAIPRQFIPVLLKLDASGYEFELDMLLACKYTQRQILEKPIQTVYEDGNKSSHFNPFLDSMRIYFVLFRFLLTSLATAAIDYTVFFTVLNTGISILASQALARFVAMLFNYSAVKKAVFLSQQRHTRTLPRYVILVLLSGTVSYFMITVLSKLFQMPVVLAKATAEGIIFLANFAILRDFVFSKTPQGAATDWDNYYKRPYKTATFTRRITEKILIKLMSKYANARPGALCIAELGGGNSCFFDGITNHLKPRQYHVIDNNIIGLEKLKNRCCADNLVLHQHDVLKMHLTQPCDVVFSVGLIEHFTPEDTKKAIEAHFALLKPNGIAVISFPTPTFLYRGSRFVSELCRMWIFHDERPLCRDEVAAALAGCGELLYEELNWKIFFTQRIMVIQKT